MEVLFLILLFYIILFLPLVQTWITWNVLENFKMADEVLYILFAIILVFKILIIKSKKTFTLLKI
jgi:hypothetical protein